VRRIEILGVTRANGLESDKRLFRQIYRIRIPTEVEPAVAIGNMRVRQVVLGIVDRDTEQLLWGRKSVVTTTANPPPADNSTGQYLSQTAGD
jgi:hypothetical protein